MTRPRPTRRTLRAAWALMWTLVCGCAHLRPGDIAERPNLRAATETAWTCLGQQDAPPVVRMVSELDCVNPENSLPGFRCMGFCRQGCTLEPGSVSLADEEGPWWTRPLVHELAHAAQAKYGMLDPLHRTAPFRKPDDCGPASPDTCAVVWTCTQKLKELGL